MELALHYYKFYKGKLKRSNFLYIILNLSIFIMLASTSVLNLWAVKYSSQPIVKYLFVGISCVTIFMTLFSGILSLYNYGDRTKIANQQKKDIENEFDAFLNKKENMYDDPKEEVNEKKLLDNVTNILNKQ